VELIVVIVILAILAAIAIPALTGYIAKAEDKEYIADARNTYAAVLSVINEAYGDGTLGTGLPDDPDTNQWKADENYLAAGSNVSGGKIKQYNIGILSIYATGGTSTGIYTLYHEKADALMGNDPSLGNAGDVPGMWNLFLLAPKDTAEAKYTILNAPGFIYWYYPEGTATGKPGIFVTYGLEDVSDDLAAPNADFPYYGDAGASDRLGNLLQYEAEWDPDAGYIVYHVVRGTW
jgi:type II secretory pathway pseudopilin PulG